LVVALLQSFPGIGSGFVRIQLALQVPHHAFMNLARASTKAGIDIPKLF
jgi:hypothetical protein